jgi:hypothetical protein
LESASLQLDDELPRSIGSYPGAIHSQWLGIPLLPFGIEMLEAFLSIAFHLSTPFSEPCVEVVVF